MASTAEMKAAFEHVFINQAWGNKQNAGKDYKRAYKKTKAREGIKKVAEPAPVAKGKKR